MHPRPEHQPHDRLWLFAGTGEGPALARHLLERGWRLRVWVVSSAAARAYPCCERLSISVGALGETAALERALFQAALEGEEPRWLVDATHPFATRIRATLQEVCLRHGQSLLRLQRPSLPVDAAVVLGGVVDLGRLPLQGKRLLLAIGARQLSQAIRCSPGALHHARILPNPAALAAAMAAGLAPACVAPLRPGPDGAIERALCRRWGIDTLLCRRSGSAAEAHWHALAAGEGLQLLLLERPVDPSGASALSFEALLERIGSPPPEAHPS